MLNQSAPQLELRDGLGQPRGQTKAYTVKVSNGQPEHMRMMMNKEQPEALRLADALEADQQGIDLGAEGMGWGPSAAIRVKAAAELRRLHAENEALRAQIGQGEQDGWRYAYAAFRGAFDTPLARRRDNRELANDARRRLSEFNERMVYARAIESAATEPLLPCQLPLNALATQTTIDRIAQEYRDYAALEMLRHNTQLGFCPADATEHPLERAANALHVANALESISRIRNIFHRIAEEDK